MRDRTISRTVETRQGASSGRAIRILARLSASWVTLAALFLASYLAATVYLLNAAPGGSVRDIDFAAFWAGAKLALDGMAVEAFDPATLRATMGASVDPEPGILYWLYPAGFHLSIAPLGALPFSVALGLVMALGVVALWHAFRPLVGALPGRLNLVLGAPPVVAALQIGQVVVFSVSILAIGLRKLGEDRPRAAGLWLGVLALKPTLVPPVLLALIAARQWACIAWAAAIALAMAGAGTAAFGWSHWQAFFSSLGKVKNDVTVGILGSDAMISPFALAHSLGAGMDAALWVQAGASLLVAAGLVVLWASDRAEWLLKCAGLAFAMPLLTPYQHFYELVFPLLGTVYLALAWPRMPWPRAGLLGLLWLILVPHIVNEAIPLAVLATPILMYFFWLIVADGASARRAANPDPTPA